MIYKCYAQYKVDITIDVDASSKYEAYSIAYSASAGDNVSVLSEDWDILKIEEVL
jgi:hypothetical protein